MKTTFSRTFSTTAIILLLSLILVGTSFQALVEDYLAESAIAELQQNSTAISNLASAYSAESGLHGQSGHRLQHFRFGYSDL